jgi:DNA-binding CsgD family transcriptional regulator
MQPESNPAPQFPPSARFRALRPDGNADRVARIASALLGVCGAYVTMRDGDRLVVVSSGGPAPIAPAGMDMPYDQTLCQFVACGRGPFAIGDTRADPRLQDMVAVTQGRVRSYLGVPITDSSGEVAGVLCGSDLAPRQWTDTEIARMLDLATLAAEALPAPAVRDARPAHEAPSGGSRLGELHVEAPLRAATSRPHLTHRETEVLHLLAEGCANREIAHRLGVGIDTVKSHVSSLLRKLEVPTRSAAIVAAMRLDLLPAA